MLGINYMTYDVRRAQDIINIKTDHCDILFLSTSIDQMTHDYQYAQVIGIYHVNLIYCNPAHINTDFATWSSYGYDILRSSVMCQ